MPGNYHSAGAFSGGYGPVSEVLFGQKCADAFYLEYDTDRAGGFFPLRFVPKDKLVVLGLFSSKTGIVENRDDILRRIEEAARFVDLDRLCRSPQCGFSSTEEGSLLTEEQPWKKVGLSKESPGRFGVNDVRAMTPFFP